MTATCTPSEHLLDAYRTAHRTMRARTAALLAAAVEIYEGRGEDMGTVQACAETTAAMLRHHHVFEATGLYPLLASRSRSFADEVDELLAAHVETPCRARAVAAALAAAQDRPDQWNVLARAVSDAAALHDHVVEHIRRSEAAVTLAAPDAVTASEAARLIAAIRDARRPLDARPTAAATMGRHELPLMVRMLKKYCWTSTRGHMRVEASC